MFKKSTVFSLHFAPSLHFTLSLQAAFYTQSAFYPWSAAVEKVLTDQHDSDSFRALTQLFSQMFSAFVAKLGSN